MKYVINGGNKLFGKIVNQTSKNATLPIMSACLLAKGNSVIKQFPDTSLIDLENAIKRYKEIDAWPVTTTFSEESFNHLQDIMLDYGAIEKKVAYKKLIYNE